MFEIIYGKLDELSDLLGEDSDEYVGVADDVNSAISHFYEAETILTEALKKAK